MLAGVVGLEILAGDQAELRLEESRRRFEAEFDVLDVVSFRP